MEGNDDDDDDNNNEGMFLKIGNESIRICFSYFTLFSVRFYPHLLQSDSAAIKLYLVLSTLPSKTIPVL